MGTTRGKNTYPYIKSKKTESIWFSFTAKLILGLWMILGFLFLFISLGMVHGLKPFYYLTIYLRISHDAKGTAARMKQNVNNFIYYF